MLDLFSHEVVSFITDAAVSMKVVGGVLGTAVADSVDSDEPPLAKTAASEPILVEPTLWRHKRSASLVGSAIDLIVSTLAADSVDEVVPESTHAGLLFN